MVALCAVEGIDNSRWMVQQGQAVAFRKYSLDYLAEEDATSAVNFTYLKVIGPRRRRAFSTASALG